jgi:NTE family protein
MDRKRIAIACQGGGSQCAFVAGALKALFAEGAHQRFQIVGLSGTSGGALTAAVAWLGLLKQAGGDSRSIEDRVVALWQDLTAQTTLEILFDTVCIGAVRMTEAGLLPSFARSPSSPQFKLCARMASEFVGRPEFTDLNALIVKHIDFASLDTLVTADSPVLLVGAADVLEGSFKVFSSVRSEIKAESVLASASIPNLFPATWVDGHAYWDGIFSSNPPVAALLQKAAMGDARLPEEIWVIQVNRARHESVPESPSDIFDRRNHLAGNLSLQHELALIDIVNLLLDEDSLTEQLRARFGFGDTRGITVRFIRMSEGVQQSLDYPSKLSRNPRHIGKLIADGEAQAHAFLAELG